MWRELNHRKATALAYYSVFRVLFVVRYGSIARPNHAIQGDSRMIRAFLLAVPLAALLFASDRSALAAEEENPVIKLVKSKVKDPAKPFALLVTFKVKAGNEKKFEEAFAPALKATRKEPGCIAYYLNRDPDHPEVYIMYESFKGVAGLDAHLKEKHTQTLLTTVVPMCEGEPSIKVLSVPE
jgi:quinol monooxygenase YgiN